MKYDVIIIGGGIAGVTAAIYLKRANKNVILIELNSIGGQIINASEVENYPGYVSIKGYELANVFKEQLNNLNIDVKYESVTKIDGIDDNFTITTNNGVYNSKKIIIATGTVSRKLGIGDRFNGRGISYCATCDGNFFKGKDVAVLGGGNAAIDDALYLSNICNKVYLIHRNSNFKAEESKVSLLKEKENVELVTDAILANINGENEIESVEVTQGDNNRVINVKGIFVCIGRINSINFINGLDNTNGFINTDEELETNIKGIYAIGDVRNKEVRQLTTAAADGTIVSSIIIKNLKK
ncbi:MAG: FAD-dependent oxidoreductase [Bacilli bacterium]|nr:FAD-dependent oxidoreductase [Bacilli bacterium]